MESAQVAAAPFAAVLVQRWPKSALTVLMSAS